ncbi:serine hydrolase domain-containing protein [Aquimarina gracilis]|uniref:Serine hydrolase domain-containing protein n=1 Tax=Aquimarina gracilis TaxID=874422 RepID=A0ABU5ZQZ9_9FLAO|nr:serine hydrolase domain-containing protein [Aquimarina gracilis]MEB3344490.1 serine hydrolase domain-containing protein [Aquimarina gracilis]
MKKIATAFALFVLCCISCSDDSSEMEEQLPIDTADLYFPPLNSDTWETLSIQELNWNQEAESGLYDFLEQKNTKAFLILKNGKIVIEKYFNGASASDNNPWNSVGKTLTAFMIGLAQQEDVLNVNNPSSTYLGTGWSTLSYDQESSITVRNHLTMTTGLNYNVPNLNCTDKDCLTYLNEPGNFWYYHNAPYTLLREIVSGATKQEFNSYFDTKLKNKIGMDGTWISLGYANIYYSSARSMARFGLLNLNKGVWENTSILSDQNYFTNMVSTSQQLNEAYGYLWWLNGKASFRAPTLETSFPGKLIPNGPDDLYAGLGKDDQKLYIVPSQNLVIVRMGDNTGEALLGPSSFDDALWEKINALIN